MILQCPLCRSQYRIQVSAEGKKVKCKQCTHVWTAKAQDFIEELEEIIQPIAVGDYPRRSQTSETNTARAAADVLPLRASKQGGDKSPPTDIPQVTEPVIPDEPASTEKIRDEIPEVVPEEVIPDEQPSLPSDKISSEQEDQPEAREYPRQKPAVDPDNESAPRFAAKHIEREKRSSLVGVSVTILAIGLFLTAVLMGRTQIVRHWPATAFMYDAVGLHVPVIGEGLRFENIQTSYDKDVEGEAIILLRGEIKNYSNETRSVPLVAIKPFDQNNKVLKNAKVKIKDDTLKAGESTSFSSEIPASTTLDPQDKFIFVDD